MIVRQSENSNGRVQSVSRGIDDEERLGRYINLLLDRPVSHSTSRTDNKDIESIHSSRS